MKQTKKTALFLLLTALLAAAILARGRLLPAWRGRQLQKNILELAAEGRTACTLNEVVPFAWDAVYTFEPYTGRAQIEAIVGFSSQLIQESVSEGQVQLLFVQGGGVAASVCGYPGRLGYRVDFSGSIGCADRTEFAVTEEDGIVVLRAKASA